MTNSDIIIKYQNMEATIGEILDMARQDERQKISKMVKENNGLIEGKDGMVVTTQSDFEDILNETSKAAHNKAIDRMSEYIMQFMNKNEQRIDTEETNNTYGVTSLQVIQMLTDCESLKEGVLDDEAV